MLCLSGAGEPILPGAGELTLSVGAGDAILPGAGELTLPKAGEPTLRRGSALDGREPPGGESVLGVLPTT